MKRNPAADWTMEDVEAVCGEYGVDCRPPTGNGSHYKVSHRSQQKILTIPRQRRIKPVYIRQLVKFLERVEGQDGQP
jgi:hypothetical protein